MFSCLFYIAGIVTCLSDSYDQSPVKPRHMNTFRTGWYLIYTKPHHEKKVHTSLTELNVNSFLPTKKTLRTWHDRKKYIDEPLFPSYVFIYLGDMQAYYEGMNTEGSLYYVRSGKKIARVDESIVNNIKLLVDKGNEIEVSDKSFHPGQQLFIREGPLTGLSCEMIQLDGTRKILVRVHLLQRNILITLPHEYLMLASAG
jgi:transcriptional antiterminator RfaH